jgi:DNA (cytosine-5)-methyltransferase 1
LNKNLSAIDLFCGIGGLSYGLKLAGIPILAGIDIDEKCKYAYEENVEATFIKEDISNVQGNDLLLNYWHNTNELKILAGCAPCQPFSTHSNKIKNKSQTKKWHLLDEFARIIKETNPEIITMENVPNLANQTIFKEFLILLTSLGYFYSYSFVFCPDYGIPQKRRRLVLLASKFGKIELIPKTHLKSDYVTVKQAIGYLPIVDAGKICESDSLHRTHNLSKINLQRIIASKPNGTWQDWPENIRLECHKKKTGNTYQAVYGRMSWDEPSPTITTQFYNYGTGRFGHPEQNRALTIREAAILQTFPKNYKFFEKDDRIFVRRCGIYIGNAVPVELGKVIGQSIIKHLGEYYGDKE